MSAENYNADFESHHIEGYAREAMNAGRDYETAYFKVPLITHVEGNLWQGGCLDGVTLGEDFKYVFSLYPWEKYRLAPGTKRVELKLYDSADMAEVKVLEGTADAINEALKEGKTLVHCQAGLNRSALLAGLALVRQGREAREVIDLLREKRSPNVLCNQAFEKFLLEYEATDV